MAFQFGTNWSELSRRSGSIQGGLLAYESFTAFALEAAFFGVLMFGRKRVPPAFYFFSCLMITFGTNLSSYWILANNSWMQHPTGYSVGADGIFKPEDWLTILFNWVTMEAARLLDALGAETRVFDPAGLPLPDGAPDDHPKVQELRDAFLWSEGQVWTSPERHGAMTGVFKSRYRSHWALSAPPRAVPLPSWKSAVDRSRSIRSISFASWVAGCE